MNPVTFKRRVGEKGGPGEGTGCISSQTIVPPSTCQKGLFGHQEMIREPLQPGCTGTNGMPLPTQWETYKKGHQILINYIKKSPTNTFTSLLYTYICLLYTLVLNAKQMGPLTEREIKGCRGQSEYHYSESPALQHTGLRGPWVLIPGYTLFL